MQMRDSSQLVKKSCTVKARHDGRQGASAKSLFAYCIDLYARVMSIFSMKMRLQDAQNNDINTFNKSSRILWFTSYLDKRKQVTLINGCMSEEVLEKPFGVPQGSVLGPFLFLIHINDVTSNVNCKSHLYADDTVLLVADKCAQNIEINLNTELEKAHRWFTENRLTLNAKKTTYMIFWKCKKDKTTWRYQH